MLWLLLYVVACIGLAAYNADLIADGKKIYHALNGLLHITFALLIAWCTKEWMYGVAVFFIAKLVFDTSLNLMRGLPVDYISPEVKSYKNLAAAFSKGKVTDYIEYKAFGGNGLIPKIIYLGIIVAIIIHVQLN